MRKQLPLLAALVVVGLANPLLAETARPDGQFCLADQATEGISDDCVALHTEFRVRVNTCMTEHQVTAESVASATGARTNHGYRALYLLCARDVRDGLGLAKN